jgi:hypothetical protein
MVVVFFSFLKITKPNMDLIELEVKCNNNKNFGLKAF